MAIDGLGATESGELWALSGLGVSLWGHSLHSLWQELDPPGAPLSPGRAAGTQLGTLHGQGIKSPPQDTLEHKAPWSTRAAPSTPQNQSGVCALGCQQPPWSPTLQPINCLGPWDEFVQPHFREEGDEIKSCNYLLKLQPLSRRTELLQTPLAGSPWMGERE